MKPHGAAARGIAALFLMLAAPPLAHAQTGFVISRQDCRLLVRHVPDPGVAYQPGVDVRGREVVSADLGGRQPIKVPEAFTIDIDVYLADRLGTPADRGRRRIDRRRKRADPKLYVAEANVAVVSVEGDRVFFEGQPLSDLRQQAVAEACREKLRSGPKVVPRPNKAGENSN